MNAHVCNHICEYACSETYALILARFSIITEDMALVSGSENGYSPPYMLVQGMASGHKIDLQDSQPSVVNTICTMYTCIQHVQYDQQSVYQFLNMLLLTMNG